jgi:asparagine synthase (glutamine-hydrolysing)
MCGILGTYELAITREYLHTFGHALALLRHRGPNRTRVWQDRRIVFGHTRLAIVDLSESADQPLHDPARRYHIVFNGEIYNYLEIRRELQSAGVVLRTNSDTEVILAAYQQWGPSCLERFNGMFAFAIYDAREHRLFAARDRYGVKPLYTWQADGQFSFASEMKALLALGAPRRPNWAQIARYLQGWGCDSDAETVYQGIRCVPPGHYVEVAGARATMTRWWDILARRVSVPARFPDRVAAFRDLLRDAVRLRLRNDVETGVCLSGGMDSSAVYGFARQLRNEGQVRFATSGQPKSFRVFSVSHPGTAVDEYPWVQRCVHFWGDHEHVSVARPRPELLPELIDDLVWHQEAPVWSSSVLALHIMYRHVARQGTRVILEGHGGDELLGGYPYLAAAAVDTYAARGDWRRTWQAARCLADTRNPAIDEDGPPAWRIFLKKLPHAPRLRRWLAWQRRRLLATAPTSTGSHRQSYLVPDLAHACPPLPACTNDALSPLRAALHSAFTQRILPMVLRVVDRATMAYSVESRAPLLDHRLVQFAFSLPDEDLVTRETKHILREAAAEVVPHAVRRRRAKLGFAIAERNWFNAPVVQSYLRDVCGSSTVRQCEFLDGRRLRADVERCVRAGFTWQDTTRIWEGLNVFLWHQRFVRRPMHADAPADLTPIGCT